MKKIAMCVAIVLAVTLVGQASQESPEEQPAVQIKEVAPFAYCCIHTKAPYTDIEKTIGELWMHMQKQSIMPTGAMFGIYFNSPADTAPEDLEWEVAFPISDIVKPEPPLEKKVWDFALVASTIHTGPYEETWKAILRIFEWVTANGYEEVGPVVERYLTVPGPDVKPEEMKSEVWVPVRKK